MECTVYPNCLRVVSVAYLGFHRGGGGKFSPVTDAYTKCGRANQVFQFLSYVKKKIWPKRGMVQCPPKYATGMCWPSGRAVPFE